MIMKITNGSKAEFLKSIAEGNPIVDADRVAA
jgi:hypothetical protein